MKSRFVFSRLLTVCLCAAGCSGSSSSPEGTISGRVTMSGAPITDGEVALFSTQHSVGASAQIKEDGTYTVESKLPTGSYSIAVQGPTSTPEKRIVTQTKIPKKYWQVATSGLVYNVTEGRNNYDIDVTVK